MGKQKSTLYESARRSVLVFLTVFAAVGLTTVLALLASEDAIEQSERSSLITQKVRRAALLLSQVESGQRGYLYTGEASFKPDIQTSREHVMLALTEAWDLSTRPELKARIDAIKGFAEKKLDELEATTRMFEENQSEQAKAVVLSGEGVQIMERFDAEVEEILAAENLFVAESRAKLDRLSLISKSIVIIGTLSLLVFKLLWLGNVKRRLAPLALCVIRARDIAENRFPDAALPVSLENDEVGSLTTSINEMSVSLRKEAGKVETARQKVQDTALNLSDRAIEQSTALTQLSSGIQEISATVQELNLSANQMSEKVGALVDEAKSREKAGARGLLAVEEADTATERVRNQVESVAQFTVALNEKAARVERIVFFVNELTERSNILSINAALLASTSGSGSEAFGVLAEEMQKLTSRSKESTLEIHETLQSIRAEIQRVVLATEETKKQVEAGDKAAKQASRSIKVLKDAVDEGNDTFLQIVAAVRQQNQALAQVEQALVAMRESSHMVEEGSMTLKEDAGVLAAMNLELQNSALLRAVR